VKILIIGSGGREHALAWRLAQAGHQVWGAPGIRGSPRSEPRSRRPITWQVAEAAGVEMTVVGPEAPLVAGVVDQFRARGLAIVGATQEAAQLEASKIHSKQFMQRLGIPTARFVRTESVDAAREALSKFSLPVVVKADGLAAGKGVIIAQTRTEGDAAIESLGPRLVIEEFLEGEEVSFIVLCDGRRALPLEATQDHKTVGDGDTGPNTGGMGAYCDGRILSAAQASIVIDRVIEPVIHATGFTGFLYAGLMMTSEGPKVLEFNVRLGDPETQPLMHRLDCDFAQALMAASQSELNHVRLSWKSSPSVCVVLAASGYPGKVRVGDVIEDRGQRTEGSVNFQAGTKVGDRGLVTAGGRVLGVTASGTDLRSAIDAAYRAVEQIHFDGMHYRRDIGQKGLKRW
jgi:phosphoribosylamine--glycine ligase